MKGTKRFAAMLAALVMTAALAGCDNTIEYKNFNMEDREDSSVIDDSSQEDSIPDDSETSDPTIGDAPLDDNSALGNQIVSETDEEYFSKAAFIGEAICSGISVYVSDIDEKYVYTENNAHIGDILDTKWSVDGVNYPLADTLFATERKYVYIWIGPNDLNNYTPAGFADKYKEVITTLFYSNPMAYVGVVSVAPVSSSYEQKLSKGKIEEYNTKLAEMVDNIGNNRVFFFNITSTLGDDSGYLLSEYDSGDGLHMTASAYKAVAQYLFDNQIHPYLSDFELPEDEAAGDEAQADAGDDGEADADAAGGGEDAE